MITKMVITKCLGVEKESFSYPAAVTVSGIDFFFFDFFFWQYFNTDEKIEPIRRNLPLLIFFSSRIL